MDYTLLTVVHPRRTQPERMDAKREQDYYERAAASQNLQEKAFAVMNHIYNVNRAGMRLTQTLRKSFEHERPAHKATS